MKAQALINILSKVNPDTDVYTYQFFNDSINWVLIVEDDKVGESFIVLCDDVEEIKYQFENDRYTVRNLR